LKTVACFGSLGSSSLLCFYSSFTFLGRLFSPYNCLCVYILRLAPLCCPSCFVLWFPLSVHWFSRFSWFSQFSSASLLSPLFWSSIVVLLWRAQVLVQLLLKMETWPTRSAGPKKGSLLLWLWSTAAENNS